MVRSEIPLVQRVARAIAARRRALGLTQEGLAERLELATKNVQRIESSAQNLTLATLERIAQALETSPAALVGAGPAERPHGERGKTNDALTMLKCAGFRVRPASSPGRRSPTAVPLTTLRAVSSNPRTGEALGWVTLRGRGPAAPGQFLAQVSGHAMEPRIACDAVCLFAAPSGPPFGDGVFLVAHPALETDGSDGAFGLRKIELKKRRHVVLRAVNPKNPPIEIGTSDLRLIAELVDVVVAPTGEK